MKRKKTEPLTKEDSAKKLRAQFGKPFKAHLATVVRAGGQLHGFDAEGNSLGIVTEEQAAALQSDGPS